jgi:hypothetical protein
MVQRGDRAGFPLEAFGERTFDRLDGNIAIEPGIVRPVDIAHASGAGRCRDFIRSQKRSGCQSHEAAIIRAVELAR